MAQKKVRLRIVRDLHEGRQTIYQNDRWDQAVMLDLLGVLFRPPGGATEQLKVEETAKNDPP